MMQDVLTITCWCVPQVGIPLQVADGSGNDLASGTTSPVERGYVPDRKQALGTLQPLHTLQVHLHAELQVRCCSSDPSC